MVGRSFPVAAAAEVNVCFGGVLNETLLRFGHGCRKLLRPM